ncbi:lipopolysaccharide heptosyltransferase II [Sporolituus thermophilus]|uniref:lipopolysaccharide heptosyltransferase II n=1 Tax=Sporolituus thermophilus DSM 23256 TaxID=1123285 RepID=A0A1G7NFX0_9FIRM|nr:lipopolysaccharide heptosyltransferase II [Sporolituus thermophilus]SDF72801.1 heptosyltransferase-1 [Sporolituus thermophilus DSM 23256]
MYHNILIIKMSAIGDVIHALPVAHALKQTWPDCRITWVVERAAYDLLTNNPDIDEIILFDKPQFKSLAGLIKHAPALARLLKSRRFDLALDLQGLGKSAAITWLSGAPKRLGYCNMRELSHWVSSPVCGAHKDGHVVERYLDVVRALGCSVDEVVFPIHITLEEQGQAEIVARQAGLDISQRYVVLAPGTNWPTKCWPTAYFAELADMLYDASVIPVIIGGPGDRRLADEIVAGAAIPPVDLTGRITLKQLAHIIKRASAFVGGDTGPMHLAVAVGTPVVALFGPTDPRRNGPYYGSNIVLQSNRNCLLCWKRTCEKICLAPIEPDKVLAAVHKVARRK